MQDIAELERRITAAMERITRGVDAMAAKTADDDVSRLTEALEEERMANAQMSERLRVLREREVGNDSGIADRLADATAKLAAQEEELLTLRRVLAEAGREIASLRAARAADSAELAEIKAALEPLVEEAPNA